MLHDFTIQEKKKYFQRARKEFVLNLVMCVSKTYYTDLFYILDSGTFLQEGFTL